MATGIETVLAGPVTKITDFTPDDKPGVRYTSFELGYVGGSIKINCRPDHLGSVAEGATVKTKVFATAKGKEVRFDAAEVKAA